MVYVKLCLQSRLHSREAPQQNRHGHTDVQTATTRTAFWPRSGGGRPPAAAGGQRTDGRRRRGLLPCLGRGLGPLVASSSSRSAPTSCGTTEVGDAVRDAGCVECWDLAASSDLVTCGVAAAATSDGDVSGPRLEEIQEKKEGRGLGSGPGGATAEGADINSSMKRLRDVCMIVSLASSWRICSNMKWLMYCAQLLMFLVCCRAAIKYSEGAARATTWVVSHPQPVLRSPVSGKPRCGDLAYLRYACA